MGSLQILCLLIALVHHSTDGQTVDTAKQWEQNYRIPTASLPIHYDLYLNPNLESGAFSGRVAIQVAVSSPMEYLVAHVKNLNVTKSFVKDMKTGMEVKLSDSFEYEPHQFWVMVPEATFVPGNYSLQFEFDGSLLDKIKGFYRSIYTNSAGEKRLVGRISINILSV